MLKITFKDVLSQLKADLIGKDSFRGVTLTYSWLANQFGHFSLGYIPCLITYSILTNFFQFENPAVVSAVIISVFWFLFELYNFLGPLLLDKPSQSKILFIPSKHPYTFTPEWGNIAFDTLTDICFFAFGAFSASLFLEFNFSVIFVLGILFVSLSYPIYYWYLTKIYIQKANYPFQFRLSQWILSLDERSKTIIHDFVKSNGQKRHLFLFGGRKSGKTNLGVGICTELSIKHKICFYVTGMKLFGMFSEMSDNYISNSELWNWRTSNYLIIDDINPGEPIEEDIISPQQFQKILDVSSDNRAALREKNVIWIMGNFNNYKDEFLSWKDMLIDIGIDESNVLSIHLNDFVTD